MSAHVLDGVALARSRREALAARVAAFSREAGRPPSLVVLRVGDDPASAVYVANKAKAAHEVGIDGSIVHLPAHVDAATLLAETSRLSQDDGIDGLLVQLPLPQGLDPLVVQRAVDPRKDVDGFHPENAGRLALGIATGLRPCTPLGVLALLDLAGTELRGAEAVVVGRSTIVGRPLALMLLERHATVTIAHSRSRDLARLCARAEVLIAAVGVPGLIRGEHIRDGAVVIDVGMNRIVDAALARDLLEAQPGRLERFIKNGSALVGDVRHADAASRARAFTPVPGGVGPLTVAMLLENTVRAAEARRGQQR